MRVKKFLGICLPSWLAAGLFTWFLYSKMDAQEIVAAAIIGAAAAIFQHCLAGYGRLGFHAQWRWILRIMLRAPWQMARGVNGLLVVLWHSLVSGVRPTGSFHERIYATGRDNGPGRRAIVVAAVSLAPTSFAVSTKDGKSFLYHQLSMSGTSPDEDWGL